MKIIVTGALGFIGSHTSAELLNGNHDLLLIDNLSNSSISTLDKLEYISQSKLDFLEIDLLDFQILEKCLGEFRPDAILHFAGLKSVEESVSQPLHYYEKNIMGTLNLLSCMDKFDTFNIVFSSSATVYGVPEYLPYDEDHPIKPTNPYGSSKAMIEAIMRDWSLTNAKKRAVALRYFNPIGAHPSGLLGDYPLNIPRNIMPAILNVASGIQDALEIYGDNYDTKDGTCIKDYIDINDLAKAHIIALEKIETFESFEVFNIGTGFGTSVLELIKAFEEGNGLKVNYKILPKRSGDLPAFYASSLKANKLLNWSAKTLITDSCKSSWNWKRKQLSTKI